MDATIERTGTKLQDSNFAQRSCPKGEVQDVPSDRMHSVPEKASLIEGRKRSADIPQGKHNGDSKDER